MDEEEDGRKDARGGRMGTQCYVTFEEERGRRMDEEETGRKHEKDGRLDDERDSIIGTQCYTTQ